MNFFFTKRGAVKLFSPSKSSKRGMEFLELPGDEVFIRGGCRSCFCHEKRDSEVAGRKGEVKFSKSFERGFEVFFWGGGGVQEGG